jgi:hypothetical protein
MMKPGAGFFSFVQEAACRVRTAASSEVAMSAE